MVGLIACLSFIALGAFLAWSGNRLWHGQDRSLLRNYRDGRSTAIIRNGKLADLPIGVMLMMLGFASAPFVLFPGLVADRTLRGALLLSGLAWVALTAGAYLVLTFRPPEWMVPPWLREDDQQTGFVTPTPTWFDKGLLVLGVLQFIIAAGLLIYAASRLAAG